MVEREKGEVRGTGHPPAQDAAPKALDVCQGQVELEEPGRHLEGHFGAQVLRQYPHLLSYLPGKVGSSCQQQGNPGPFPARKALPIPLPHQTLQLPEGEGKEVDLDDAAKDTSQTPARP